MKIAKEINDFPIKLKLIKLNGYIKKLTNKYYNYFYRRFSDSQNKRTCWSMRTEY